MPTGRRTRTSAQVLAELAALSATDLLDLEPGGPGDGPARHARGPGLARPARAGTGCWRACRGMPGAILDRVVEHFGGLQKLLAASVEDLQVVDGVGETRARAVREAISRLAEVSIIDRYSLTPRSRSADRELGAPCPTCPAELGVERVGAGADALPGAGAVAAARTAPTR